MPVAVEPECQNAQGVGSRDVGEVRFHQILRGELPKKKRTSRELSHPPGEFGGGSRVGESKDADPLPFSLGIGAVINDKE